MGSIVLVDGGAEHMGDGVFVLVQDSEEGPQSVVVTRADLEALLAVSERM